MSKEKELAGNTIILFIGTFFTKIIQYFLLPIYTGYLNSSEYGEVELFNTFIYLLIPIIGLQIEHGIFRFLISNRDNESKKGELISSTFFFVFLSTIVYFIIFILINNFINYEYKWLLLLNLFLCNTSSILLQISRGLGKNSSYSFSSFIIALTTIICNIFFLIQIKLKVNGMILGGTFGYLLGILYLFFRLKLYKYISLKDVNKKSIVEMIKYSVPMIPNTLSWWIFSSSDRIIISYFIDLSATGLLSIAYKFSNIGIVIYNVFNMSLTESVALHIDDIDVEDYFNKVYNSIGNVFISFCIIIISAMPIIFKFLINSDYNDAYNLIPIAIVATCFQVLASMFGTIYIAKKNTKSVAITSIIAAIINIVTDLFLVKFIGVYAAIISTIISYIVLFIYRLIDINRKYIKIKIKKELILCVIVILTIICPLYYINNIFSIIISILLGAIFLILVNKENYVFLKKLVLKKKGSKT